VTGNFASEGLAQRLNGVIRQYTGSQGVISSEISGESSLIASLNDQKAEWDVRLQEQQTALQTKFSNMESALSSLQSQGSWLTSAIAKL
jgi:flagellar hook-associated protein 2